MPAATHDQNYAFSAGLRADLKEEFTRLGGRTQREMNNWAEQLAGSITDRAKATPQPILALSGDVGDMSYLRWAILKFKLEERGCLVKPLPHNQGNWSVRKAE